MAKKKTASEATRKRRTREHVTEDMSLHHITGLILQAGFAINRVDQDYSINLWVQTFNSNGEVEEEAILMQLKAAKDLNRYALNSSLTPSMSRTCDFGRGISCRCTLSSTTRRFVNLTD